ncbi:hypothetical protein [Nostoc sp. NMS4]|uniref:hypothetical protein n=1 Tax=Nostoc sp. NMS4 TaxID=2815390 RepID=UPI0025F52DBB|nr:hypothetical protein [Nostoc sp. NMS4]MBN3922246.1 hypothetical protein [Nostoc sp. NMS4]
MAENSEITPISENKTDLKLSASPELEKIPLLPRSAWNSQLGYLKVLLKAKQLLDKS